MLPTACPRSMLTASPTFSLARFRAFAACSKQSRARPAVRARPLWATWRAVPLRTRHLGRVESPASSQQCTRLGGQTGGRAAGRTGFEDRTIAPLLSDGMPTCAPERSPRGARGSVPTCRLRRSLSISAHQLARVGVPLAFDPPGGPRPRGIVLRWLFVRPFRALVRRTLLLLLLLVLQVQAVRASIRPA